MYWWNASKLADDLREGRVGEKERFNYYLATFIAWNLAAQLFFHDDGIFGIERLVSVALSLAVIIVGVIVCYKANKSGDNTDFVGRMICLGWPVGFKLAVIVLTFSLAFVVAISLADHGLGRPFMSALSDQIREFWRPRYWPDFLLPYYFSIAWYLIFVTRGEKADGFLQMRKTEWSAGRVALGIVGGIGILVYAGFIVIQMANLGGNSTQADLLFFCSIILPIGLLLFWPLLRRIYERQ